MAFKNGYLYFINPCSASIPVKPKFAICMSASENLFYLVNSCDQVRPYKHEVEHSVRIQPSQLKSLSHESYVNVSKPREIGIGDFVNAEEKEFQTNDLWLRLKKHAMEDKKLEQKYKKIIEKAKK